MLFGLVIGTFAFYGIGYPLGLALARCSAAPPASPRSPGSPGSRRGIVGGGIGPTVLMCCHHCGSCWRGILHSENDEATGRRTRSRPPITSAMASEPIMEPITLVDVALPPDLSVLNESNSIAGTHSVVVVGGVHQEQPTLAPS